MYALIPVTYTDHHTNYSTTKLQSYTIFKSENDITNAIFSHDMSNILITSRNTVKLYDSNNYTFKTLYGHSKEVNTALFSKDGSMVITASDDNDARVNCAKTGKDLAIRCLCLYKSRWKKCFNSV